MKLALNLSFFLFMLVSFDYQSFSLTNYRIKKICQNEKKPLICIKNLQKKNSDLQKGKQIEIPVIPYKR